jgi:hypothetical protein
LCINEYTQRWHREKRGRNFRKATIYQRVPEYLLGNEFQWSNGQDHAPQIGKHHQQFETNILKVLGLEAAQYIRKFQNFIFYKIIVA